MVLNDNQAIIIRELCEIQFISLSDIIPNIQGKEEEFIEMGFPRGALKEVWEETCGVFMKLQESPQHLDSLHELDLWVVTYILRKHGDTWRYKYPVAFKTLVDRVNFLIRQKSILNNLIPEN